ncbi:MAG: glycosyltransferase family 4 protein [Candidatus Cloacimonetes bacterium]|nr:glycosyltransferase family 4 protein [Candidatus Cloacimonadota bacterium]
MKILYITQYFAPEVGATTNRALANARYLSQKGHSVTVLTEMPNHPKGIIFNGYKHKIFMKEKMENFLINRVWVFTSVKKNFITRILFYVSFMFMGFLHTLFNWKKYDIVYVSSPPLFVGVIGLWLKKIFRKTKFVFEVRDLWPDGAIEMGELKNKHFRKFSYSLEKQLYENAEKIISVTERFKEHIIAKGFEEKKIDVIRNGSDLSFTKVDISEEFKKQYNSENNFIVVYAGNLGIAQNLKTLLESAKQLDKDDIKFLLIGTGPEEKQLKKFAKKEHITNVDFCGEIPKKNVSEYLSLADCGIIPLKNIKVFESTIPSKLFDYMSADLPILLGVTGEAAYILKESEAGIIYKPDNSEDLAEKIIWMKNHPKERIEMGKRGRKFVEKYYNREKKAEKLEKELLNLLKK